MSENEENVSPNDPALSPFEPYTVLKIDRDASNEAIQKSYKLLSRSFHPDKHAPGPSRDAAQEVFVQFKNAHDLLTDPVQRQVFDEHGHDGIAFVRRSLHAAERDPKSLYPTLAKLHQEGKSEEARLVLREALQQADVEQRDRAARMSATLEFPCTLETQSFVGGDEEGSFPELKDAHLSFSVTSSSPSPDSKWNMTVGGSTNVENGKGSGSGSVAVEYVPVQGTQISADVDIGDPFKFSIGTTRMLSSRTMMTASLRTIPNTEDLSLSLGSHRNLFENKLRASWALGMGSNLRFHYGLLSFTTTSDDYPTCTAKLNLGISSFPLKLTAKHEFESGQSGYVSYAWGPTGIEIKTIFARALTSYAVWSIGVRHSIQSGLTWLLQLERNEIVFRIPITICRRNSSAYWEKSILLSLVSFLVDSCVRDIVENSESIEAAERGQLKRESSLLDADKSRRAAEQQIQMMTESALASRAREEACDGLVILKALYYVDGGESMDATIQIQFRVKENSKLQLPSTPKSHLLGFYSLAETPKGTFVKQSWYESWFPWLLRQTENDSNTPASPKLTVRYSYLGKVYETTIEDKEALVLPQEDALCLGESNVVVE
jgi:hypothetical protein